MVNDKLQSSEVINEINAMVSGSGITYIDALVEYCAINNIEVESIAKVIRTTPTLKAKIEQEAGDLNLLQKESKLPI